MKRLSRHTADKKFELHALTPDSIKTFQALIYDYYSVHGRSFPWRETTNPYHILVSEFMLQQTQTQRVVAKYSQFIKTFPNSHALAEAPFKDVLAVWQVPIVKMTLDYENPREWYYALMDYGVMIKNSGKNPGRKSALYQKQSPFEGSDRQIRGKILHILLETPQPEEVLIKECGPPQRVMRIIRQLEREGFIKKMGKTYSIV